MGSTNPEVDQLCINTIRGLALDAVQKAKSGHPGLPLGAAAMGYDLWTRHMRFNPKNPHWFDRDRFILSAGHGCMLQYALLHLCGFDLSIDDLKNFRQLHSRTPGHPEIGMTPGVEMSTGPLGQGIAHAVGFAIAEAFLAARYNRQGHTVVDHFTYGICSDGDLMEGVSNEAASLAGHLGLGKLIFLYDDNGITIDGPTSLAFTESVQHRYDALGWHTLVVNGEDLEAVHEAVAKAKAETGRPSLILCRTVIGYGAPNMQGTNKIHSNPLPENEYELTKAAYGLPKEISFSVSDAAKAHFAEITPKGADLEKAWEARMDAYAAAFPAEAAELRNMIAGEMGDDWIRALPVCTEKVATRKAGQNVIKAVFPHMPTIIGGSADLVESNLTHQSDRPDFQADSQAGYNINFGIREHAMAAAVNGINLHGGTIGFGASFMVFTDYARPALRLAAIMECPSIFVFTHDSIGVGEDGPTHEPVEHLTALRAIPNFNVIRPADGNETAAAWKIALESTKTPTLLALTRQGVPPITPDCVQNHPAEKGGYVLAEADGGTPKLILIGTGSEVQHCLTAREALQAEGIPTRVVSLPSWFLFDRQTEAYRKSVIDRSIPTVSIEAGSTIAWARYADVSVGVDQFGLSAPGDLVMKELGITAEHLIQKAKERLGL